MAEQIVVVGGGAAGFFAAIACGEASPGSAVSIFERGSQFLTKVRISGGGRCNVTHAREEPLEFSRRYPRGQRELISPLHRFDADDAVAWFEARGVALKMESDGRIFPVSDSSATIVDCLLREAASAGVNLFNRRGIERIDRTETGQFVATDTNGDTILCDRVLLATGGARNAQAVQLARALGHTTEPGVPSLFTFHAGAPWLRALPGVSMRDVALSVAESRLHERGPLLITHGGLSGPVVLRLSAWGARELHEREYRFVLRINWTPDQSADAILTELSARRLTEPNRLVVNSPLSPLPTRLWDQLALAAGVATETRWTNLPRPQTLQLAQRITRTELSITGKSLNKDEFVTCGGVRLREISFKTMESRITPHLYFAGEILDIDGITGGYNFQNAWTTGWIAGRAMAGLAPS
ncbi:MAG: NAD(P)/FAD-dependent oxidoreductase [Verrucomicrobiota bacterium]|nr:NAD(P)/FAD-dependent oxidoreductase [Verrucomicrobiota bacterium]